MSSPQNQTAARQRLFPYRAKKAFSPAASAAFAAGVVAIVVAAGLFTALTGVAVLGGAFLLAYPPLYRRHVASTTALGVYRRVLVIGGEHVPWDGVAEVALTGPTPDGGTAFAVRLREGQMWAAGLGRHRPDAQGFHLHGSTTRRVDLSKLRAALRVSAPGHVELTGF